MVGGETESKNQLQRILKASPGNSGVFSSTHSFTRILHCLLLKQNCLFLQPKFKISSDTNF